MFLPCSDNVFFQHGMFKVKTKGVIMKIVEFNSEIRQKAIHWHTHNCLCCKSDHSECLDSNQIVEIINLWLASPYIALYGIQEGLRNVGYIFHSTNNAREAFMHMIIFDIQDRYSMIQGRIRLSQMDHNTNTYDYANV